MGTSCKSDVLLMINQHRERERTLRRTYETREQEMRRMYEEREHKLRRMYEEQMNLRKTESAKSSDLILAMANLLHTVETHLSIPGDAPELQPYFEHVLTAHSHLADAQEKITSVSAALDGAEVPRARKRSRMA